MSATPQFKPLGLNDATDEQIEAFAARKGMPTMLRPVVAEVAPVTAPEADVLRRVTLNLPDYVAKQLHSRAVEARCTVRHIIMTALQKDGIEIRDADMVSDGRRLR